MLMGCGLCAAFLETTSTQILWREAFVFKGAVDSCIHFSWVTAQERRECTDPEGGWGVSFKETPVASPATASRAFPPAAHGARALKCIPARGEGGSENAPHSIHVWRRLPVVFLCWRSTWPAGLMLTSHLNSMCSEEPAPPVAWFLVADVRVLHEPGRTPSGLDTGPASTSPRPRLASSSCNGDIVKSRPFTCP